LGKGYGIRKEEVLRPWKGILQLRLANHWEFLGFILPWLLGIPSLGFEGSSHIPILILNFLQLGNLVGIPFLNTY